MKSFKNLNEAVEYAEKNKDIFLPANLKFKVFDLFNVAYAFY